ncbi:hypothetical protein BH10CYA1_BH10CYA1_55830 [soil metagenome]
MVNRTEENIKSLTPEIVSTDKLERSKIESSQHLTALSWRQSIHVGINQGDTNVKGTYEASQVVASAKFGTDGSIVFFSSSDNGPKIIQNKDLKENIEKDNTSGRTPADILNVQNEVSKHVPVTAGADGKNQRETYLENAKTFVERARSAGLADQQVSSVFTASLKLLESPNAKVSQPLRIQLAQQIMAESAYPGSIDQGNHQTCGMSDIESRTWTKSPAIMANMVAKVAIDGSYTAADGKLITIPPQNLIPDTEAQVNPPKDGTRSFASQIIQATMLNDIGQRLATPWYFTQLTPTNSSRGEFWTDASGTPLTIQAGDRKGQAMEYVGSNPGFLVQEIKRLTGEDGIVFNHHFDGISDKLTSFKSEAELAQKLLKAKNDGKFPIIISVYGEDPAFGKRDSGIEKKQDHVVCINDYDPKTSAVLINNSSGSIDDKWIKLDRFYQTTN